MKINKLLIILLFLSPIGRLYAQNATSLPLARILQLLENRFNVVFTYTNENIDDISINVPKETNTLNQCLNSIEKQCNLEFQQLNDRYIAIIKSKKHFVISGTLIDKSTHEVINGAYIYTQKSYTLSNNHGNFLLETAPSDTNILIRHTSYKPLQLSIRNLNNKKDTFELTPDNYILKEVVINYITNDIDKLKDGTIVLQSQKIETLPGLSELDILKSIQTLPGIQSVRETVANINIRGGTNDQNLVLWDGVKIYQTGHFFGLISAFDSHLIYETRITKNGTGTAIGEGVSGIVDLKLQDNIVSKWSTSGGYNMISSDLITKIPVNKKLSLIFSVRNSLNNLFKSPTYNSYFKRAFAQTDIYDDYDDNEELVDYNYFFFRDLTCKVLYNISDKDKIRISFLDINNQIKYIDKFIKSDSIYTNNSKLKQTNILSNINYSHIWNNKNKINISSFISNYNLYGKGLNEENNQYHIEENEVIDWGIKTNLEHSFIHSIKTKTGYAFNEIGIRNKDNDNIRNLIYYRANKDVLRIHSFYTEAELSNILQKVYLKVGVRADYYSKFSKLLIEPRTSLNYKFSNSISGEISYETKSQHTSQQIDYQNDFQGIEERRWVLANNNSIPLVRSKQYSAGLTYQPGNFLVSLEAYKKNVSGIISPSQGFQNQYEFVYAIGGYKTHGIEFLVNKYYNQLIVWLGYTYAQNNYNFSTYSPSVFPNNLDIRHSFNSGAIYTYKKFKFSTGINYRTGIPYTKPSEDNNTDDSTINYEMANSSRLKDYMRMDISAKYNFNIGKLKGECGFTIWNVLNHDNLIKRYYQKNELNEIEEITQNALDITPNVNLRLWYSK